MNDDKNLEINIKKKLIKNTLSDFSQILAYSYYSGDSIHKIKLQKLLEFSTINKK